MPKIAILGSTGSIGTQTLQVIDLLPDYEVVALAAGSNSALLEEQIERYRPRIAALRSPEEADRLQQIVDIPVLSGETGLCELAALEDVDLVVVSVVGFAGLRPTLTALNAGKRVALANKESLVAGGHLVMEYATQVIPIDSEHNALWQCLDGKNKQDVTKLILTASGGPFRSYQGSLAEVTVAQALNHPRWNMGGKISIDSATLMNKGLEVIEAHWLFDYSYNDIEVIVHPESAIHSMVRFADSTVLAQLAVTDMRIPIQYALTYPKVYPVSHTHLDLVSLGSLTFEEPNMERFPCLPLAYEAGRSGGAMPIVLNAANEIAVRHFLDGHISFADIPVSIREILSSFSPGGQRPTLEEILEIDLEARIRTQEWLKKRFSCFQKG